MKKISLRQVGRQLLADLIGKDVYRGVTHTYTLLANQFGHFALGFIPVTIFYSLRIADHLPGFSSHWPWAGWAGGCIIFESGNYWYSILLYRRAARRKFGMNDFPFKPSWPQLRLDLITDMGFFFTGASCAGWLFLRTTWLMWVFILSLVIFKSIFFHWYIIKIYVQEALFPFQFRLSQWTLPISDENKIAALSFRENRQKGRHLLVFSDQLAEKASLCIGIATEMAFRKTSCLYVTAMQLLPRFSKDLPDSNHSLDLVSIWTWREVDVLLIDDINPTHSGADEMFTAEMFYNEIHDETFREENLAALKEKNVIWMLGSDNPERKKEKSWRENLLLKIGIPAERITVIHL
ncbi:MAG: hypothetical protein U0X40_07485 [Ferruginibacter sp.]